jgi:hypothetical protein
MRGQDSVPEKRREESDVGIGSYGHMFRTKEELRAWNRF